MTNVAGVLAPTLALGAVAAAAATGPTLFPRDAKLTAAGAGASGLLGMGAGALLGTAAVIGGRFMPGGRVGAFAALAGVGAAAAGAAHLTSDGRPQGGAAWAATGGMVAAAAGAAGLAATGAAAGLARLGASARFAAPAVAVLAGGAVLALTASDNRRDAGRPYHLPDIGLPKVDPDVTLLDTPRDPAFLRGSMPGVDPASVAWEQLPGSGRRFLWQRTSTEEISRVMGTPAKAEPRRVYVGLDEAPAELQGPGMVGALVNGDDPAEVAKERKLVAWMADTAYERMVQSGAFERSEIFVVPTTATGYINPLVPMTIEMSTLGDSAIVGMQAGRKKAAFEMHNLDRAAAMHEALLERIKQHVDAMPADQRPTVNVYGESFGAGTSQDALQGEGFAEMDRLGVARAMYTGSPHGAQWSKQLAADEALTAGGSPEVLAISSGKAAEQVGAADAADARVTLLAHDADPVTHFTPEIGWERPAWLGSGERGENISRHQRWWPGVSLVTTAIDQQNAQYFKDGTVEAKGHDYRAEISYVMRRAFGYDHVSDQQVARMREFGRQLELRHLESPPPAG